MTLSLKHSKQSEKSDGQDDSLIQPTDWNAEHVFTVEAERLIGNSTNLLGNAEEISVGAGLKLEDGALTTPIVESDKLVISSADATVPDARVLTNTATITWDTAIAKQIKANVVPAPAPAPVFYGAPHAVLIDKKASGTAGGTFNTGAWRDRVLNEKLYDLNSYVTLVSSDFTLVAGTYVVEWSAPAFNVNKHQSRLWNKTDSVLVEAGTSEASGTSPAGELVQTRSTGIAHFTVAAGKSLTIQHQCHDSYVDGFGADAAHGISEIYTVVKIWRVA